MELGDQPRSHDDHDRAQEERPEDADHQHALLECGRHAEIGEQHQEHEDVVDCQRLLDQIAGPEFQRLVVGQHPGGGVVTGAAEVPPQPAAKGDRHGHPDQRPDGCLLHRDGMGALSTEGEKVDEKGHDNEQREQRPQQRRADGQHVNTLCVIRPGRRRRLPERRCRSCHPAAIAARRTAAPEPVGCQPTLSVLTMPQQERSAIDLSRLLPFRGRRI